MSDHMPVVIVLVRLAAPRPHLQPFLQGVSHDAFYSNAISCFWLGILQWILRGFVHLRLVPCCIGCSFCHSLTQELMRPTVGDGSPHLEPARCSDLADS